MAHPVVASTVRLQLASCCILCCLIFPPDKGSVSDKTLPLHSAAMSYVQGLTIDDKSAAKLKATADELVEERQLALECIREAH